MTLTLTRMDGMSLTIVADSVIADPVPGGSVVTLPDGNTRTVRETPEDVRALVAEAQRAAAACAAEPAR